MANLCQCRYPEQKNKMTKNWSRGTVKICGEVFLSDKNPAPLIDVLYPKCLILEKNQVGIIAVYPNEAPPSRGIGTRASYQWNLLIVPVEQRPYTSFDEILIYFIVYIFLPLLIQISA